MFAIPQLPHQHVYRRKLKVFVDLFSVPETTVTIATDTAANMKNAFDDYFLQEE